MGAWGTGLFSNDTAADARDTLRDLIIDGADPAAAIAVMVEEFQVAELPDDANDFWLAVAVTLHKAGRVDPDARSLALAAADDPEELSRWPAEHRSARTRALRAARELLLSEPPPPRRLRRPTRATTNLEPGQHARLPIGEGRPDLLLRVIDVNEGPSGRYPVVLVLDWDGTENDLQRAHRLPAHQVECRQGGTDALAFWFGSKDPAALVLLANTSDEHTPITMLRGMPWGVLWKGIGDFFESDGRPLADLVRDEWQEQP